MRKTCLLVPVTIAILASTAHAQRSNTQGILANAHFSRTSLKTNGSKKTDMGNGVGVRLGWGFSPHFTAYLGGAVSKLFIADLGGDNNYGLVQSDLGVAYNFGSSSKALRPYLDVAVTSHTIQYSVGGSDIKQSGTGFTLGGGINYFFSRSAALQAGLDFTSTNFADATVDGAKQADSGGSASGGRLMVGFTWYPMKK